MLLVCPLRSSKAYVAYEFIFWQTWVLVRFEKVAYNSWIEKVVFFTAGM